MKKYWLIIFLLLPAHALAHSLSDSFLNLQLENNLVQGHWLIAVKDIELAVGLDVNADARISWGEILQQRQLVETHLLSRLQVSMAGQSCAISSGDFMLEPLSAGMYLHVPLTARCDNAGALEVAYSFLFDLDSAHRGIMNVQSGSESAIRVFSPQNPVHTMDSGSVSALENLWVFLVEGVWHIWIGLDHILFLCALLVPIVLARSQSVGGKTSINHIFVEILKVVTAFTVAHSITLILATLEIVVLPARLIESVIALSVAVSGLNILWPIFRGHTWKFAFAFGLIHGFGFANVLGDLSLPTHLFVSSLLSFNVGVEIGQLAIVLVLVPLLLLLGRASRTRILTLTATGVVITGFGLLWLAERSLDVSIATL